MTRVVTADRHAEEFRALVALGESITAGGWSTRPDRCWVSVLGTLIDDLQSAPIRVVNAGIGSNVISTRSPCYEHSGKPAGDERLERHVLAHQPDLLLVSYGLNDMLGGTPPELFQELLAGLVRRVRDDLDPVIVLLGPYYMTDFAHQSAPWTHGSLSCLRRFNDAVGEVATSEHCLYVDVVAATGDIDWMVHDDGVHQNDLGHRVIANRVFEVLARNCSCLAKQTRDIEKTSPRWRDERTLKADYGY